ncbi:MAG: hypothetical protein LBS94_02735 [Prevotellaceae bacterium]|jgi:hypothetical protein|nr:hypothetical protein [Prevotellaceae bacterium]
MLAAGIFGIQQAQRSRDWATHAQRRKPYGHKACHHPHSAKQKLISAEFSPAKNLIELRLAQQQQGLRR